MVKREDFYIGKNKNIGLVYHIPSSCVKKISLEDYPVIEKIFSDVNKNQNIIKEKFIDYDKVNIDHININKENNKKLKKLEIIMCNDCNLNCKYCYANAGTYNKEKTHMKSTDIKKYISYLFSKIYDDIGTVMFFGGEPLLDFSSIKAAIDEFNSLYNKRLIRNIPKYNIITNATLVTDEMCDFFYKNKFNITVSLDGPIQIHDNLRPYKDNRGSYQDIKKNIEKLKKYNCNVDTVECTYTSEHIKNNISKTDLNNFFIEKFKFKNILICDCHGESEYSIKSKDTLSFDAYERTKLQIYRMLNSESKYNYYCGAGIDTLTIDPKGDIYPCHFFMDDINNIICNIKKFNLDSNITKKIKDLYNYNNGACSKCWARELCTYCPSSMLVFNLIDKVGKGKFCDEKRTHIEKVLFETVSKL